MLSGYLQRMRLLHFVAFGFYCFYCYQSYSLGVAVHHATLLFICWYALEAVVFVFGYGEQVFTRAKFISYSDGKEEKNIGVAEKLRK